MKRRNRSRVFEVDPERPQPPDGLPIPQADTGEVVALVAEEGPRSHGWSARFAVELARQWSAAEIQVLLADGDLSGASLHTAVGEPNAEGLADLVMYGASADKVARRVSDGGLMFIPSGTVLADPERAYGEPRWASVLSKARSTGTILLLYLPAESPGALELSAEADRLIRLSSAPPEGELEPRVTVVHGPGGEKPTTDSIAPSSAPAGTVGDPNATGQRAPAARKGGGGTDPRKRVSRAFLLALLVVLVVVVLVAGWLGYITIPVINPSSSSPALAPPILVGFSGL